MIYGYVVKDNDRIFSVWTASGKHTEISPKLKSFIFYTKKSYWICYNCKPIPNSLNGWFGVSWRRHEIETAKGIPRWPVDYSQKVMQGLDIFLILAWNEMPWCSCYVTVMFIERFCYCYVYPTVFLFWLNQKIPNVVWRQAMEKTLREPMIMLITYTSCDHCHIYWEYKHVSSQNFCRSLINRKSLHLWLMTTTQLWPFKACCITIYIAHSAMIVWCITIFFNERIPSSISPNTNVFTNFAKWM